MSVITFEEASQLPPDEFVVYLRGKSNSELRDKLAELYRESYDSYEYGELLDEVVRLSVEGCQPISDFNRPSLIGEVFELMTGEDPPWDLIRPAGQDSLDES